VVISRFEVQGAERQGFEADLGVTPGQGRNHQHPQFGPLVKQERQRFEAVHYRHLDVKQDDVGSVRTTSSTASLPLAWRATTSRPGSSSIQRETRPRTTAESSTIITLMGFAGSVGRPGAVTGACMLAT